MLFKIRSNSCSIPNLNVSSFIPLSLLTPPSAKLGVWKSCTEFDQGRRNTYYASIGKLYGAIAANENASDAVQIFGG